MKTNDKHKTRMSTINRSEETEESSKYSQSHEDRKTNEETTELSLNDGEMESNTMEDLISEALDKHEKQTGESYTLTSSKEVQESDLSTKHEEKIKTEDYKDDPEILGVTIHNAGKLDGPLFCYSQPTVKIHICDIDQGDYLLKSDPKRKVTSFYEPDTINYILPIMTQPYEIFKKRSMLCQWNEQLIMNESFRYISDKKHEIFIFFQIMDHINQTIKKLTSSVKSKNKLKDHQLKTIAWAFLKLRSFNGKLNTNQRLRLQLYRPKKSRNVELKELYIWWKSGNRIKYPSTLDVLVRNILIPENPNPSLRSMLPTQEEKWDNESESRGNDLHSLQKSNQSENIIENSLENEKPLRKRKANKIFKLPTKIKESFSFSDYGAMVVKFSNSGSYLACGGHKTITIFDLEKEIQLTISQHNGLIYEICWSDNDKLLLSTSADSTARVWHIDNFKRNAYDCIILTHPSYVYCGRFIPYNNRFIITGCYDNIVRVWMSNSGKYEVVKEMSNHLGYISSLCFNERGDKMFTGDKQGVILAWSININKGSRKCKIELEKEIKINDICSKVINNIEVHPNGHRILVHLRISEIYLVNYEHSIITHRLKGILNNREQIRSRLSPCGTWAISGSEEGSVYVWNCDSGEVAKIFLDLPFQSTISCIDFHPFEDMVVISSYKENTPIIIMEYNELISNDQKNLNDFVHKNKPIDDSKDLENHEIFGLDSDDESLLLGNTRKPKKTNKTNKSILRKLDLVLKLASNQISKSEEKNKTNIGEIAYAIYDFNANEKDELSLKKGDFVTIKNELNEDWWMVMTSDETCTGLVPANYLSKVKDSNADKGDIEESSDLDVESNSTIKIPPTSSENTNSNTPTKHTSKARARRRQSQNV